MNNYYRNTIIEIDTDRFTKNLNVIKEECSKYKFLYAVIKGDAYGHGIVQIAKLVIDSNVDGIAVATLDEAIIVRKYYKDIKILCLGIIRDQDVIQACQQDITITVANISSANYLKELSLPKQLSIHLKANTGMNRIGFKELFEYQEAISLLETNKDIKIEGIFTHFATAEGYGKEEYFQMQLKTFKDVVENLDYNFEQIHCTNSSSLLKYHDILDFTTANRVGIVMYGGLEDKVMYEYDIEAAFSLKSIINQVQQYPEGTKIGYNNNYTTINENEIIATIPLGYADGFARLHTGSKVKCNDQYGTIIGSICMDQMMIKFESCVSIGDEVILQSTDPEIDVFARATQAQTITHEIFTRFSNRIPKLYLKDGKIIDIDNALLNK